MRVSWLRALGVALSGALISSCSPEVQPVDPGFVLLHAGSAHEVATPVEFMTQAGCRTTGPVIGAVAIGRPETKGYDLFDCSSLSADSLRSVTTAYKQLIEAARLRGASLAAPPGGDDPGSQGDWEATFVHQVCPGDAGGTQSGGEVIHNPDNSYTLSDQTSTLFHLPPPQMRSLDTAVTKAL
jgi:hypothetical protein